MTAVERIIPDETPSGIVALHLKRYQFARRNVAGKRVLDLACGVGYGSRYLSEVGCKVVGADIDRASIDYACHHYGGPKNLAFVQSDATRTGFGDAQFDVICSFETIEHMYDVDLFLTEIKRVLTPNGMFFVSTPRVQRSDSHPDNPFHFHEWSTSDFVHLISTYFKQVVLFGQSRRETRAALWLKRLDVLKLRKWLVPMWMTRGVAQASGVRATADLHLEDVIIRRGDLRGASEIVVIASDENHRN